MSTLPRIHIKWTFPNGEEKLLSLKEVGVQVGKSENSIGYYYRGCNCKTQEDIIAKVNSVGNAHKVKEKHLKQYDFKPGKMSIRKYLRFHHPHNDSVNYQTMANRLRIYDPKHPVIDYPKMSPKAFRKRMEKEGLAVKKPPKTVYVEIEFDNSICYKNGHRDKCKHYVSCSDSRCFEKKHHKRYKEDGSCFSK